MGHRHHRPMPERRERSPDLVLQPPLLKYNPCFFQGSRLKMRTGTTALVAKGCELVMSFTSLPILSVPQTWFLICSRANNFWVRHTTGYLAVHYLPPQRATGL